MSSFTIKRFQKDNFNDVNLEQIQTTSEKLWNDIRNHTLIKGSLFSDMPFNLQNSFEYHLPHKLNRVPKGYIVVRNNSNFPLYDTGMDEKFIYFLTDGAATISVWVF